MINFINPYKFSSASSLPLDNIISAWKLDTNGNDSVGSNNGTEVNATYTTVGVHTCVDLTAGTNSRVTVPDADNLSVGNGTTNDAFSFTGWAYMLSDKTVYFFGKHNFVASREYGFKFTTTASDAWEFYVYDTSLSVLNYVRRNFLVPPLNQWFSYAVTCDGSGNASGMKMYIDGADISGAPTQGSGFVAAENTVAKFQIGQIELGNDNLNGYQTKFFYWDKELSSDEVLDIHNAQATGADILL